MKIRPYFIVTSILATLFGLGFMFMPGFLTDMINFGTEGDGPLAMRFFGIMVLGLGVLTFRALDLEDPKAQKAIALPLSVVYTLMSIFHIWAIFTLGVGNLMLWSIVVLHAVFAVIYGIFAFKPA
jgi:hypothetical protein